MKKIQNNNIIIGMPDGWGDASNVILLDKTKSDFNPNLAINKEFLSEPTDVISYGENLAKTLEEEFANNAYSIIEEGPIELNNIKAYRRIHRFVLWEEGNLQVQQLQIYFVTNEHMVTVTASDLVHRFDESYQVFQEALNLLEIIE
jgi:hypothetical protein